MTSAHSPSAYEELRKLFTRLSRFDHLSAISGWDMQTMMPPGGNQARSEALAELSVLKHQLLTATKTGALLDRAQQYQYEGFYAAANYTQSYNAIRFGTSHNSTLYGYANKAQSVEVYTGYTFDFGLQPFIGWNYVEGKDLGRS